MSRHPQPLRTGLAATPLARRGRLGRSSFATLFSCYACFGSLDRPGSGSLALSAAAFARGWSWKKDAEAQVEVFGAVVHECVGPASPNGCSLRRGPSTRAFK